ncbi:MAG: hypothetical protein R3225_11330, partial [Halofilum sp. (in: g-proteobacteria)]|nr:hypothetical protein [Halofilum sp. (in: g-proteobacteria)]
MKSDKVSVSGQEIGGNAGCGIVGWRPTGRKHASGGPFAYRRTPVSRPPLPVAAPLINSRRVRMAVTIALVKETVAGERRVG